MEEGGGERGVKGGDKGGGAWHAHTEIEEEEEKEEEQESRLTGAGHGGRV